MGLMDWALGPKRGSIDPRETFVGASFGPRRLNIDDLRRIATKMETLGPVVVRTGSGVDLAAGAVGEPLEGGVGALAGLHPVELREVQLSIEQNTSGEMVGLLAFYVRVTPLSVDLWASFDGTTSGQARLVHAEIKEILDHSPRGWPDEGHALRLVRAGRAVLVGAALVVFVLVVRDWALCALAVVVAWLAWRVRNVDFLREWHRRRAPAWLNLQSREALRMDRANRRANARVAGITALITGPVSVALGVYLQATFGG